MEDWSADLRQTRKITVSTLRTYHLALRMFCDYLVDPRYGWGERCLELFGSHPVQVCHEWNTVAHVVEMEARPAVRPLTRAEVQALFDYADEQVDVGRRLGARAGRRRGATPRCSRSSTPLAYAGARPRCST